MFSPTENNIDIEDMELRFGGRMRDKNEYYPPKLRLKKTDDPNTDDVTSFYKSEFHKLLNVTRVTQEKTAEEDESGLTQTQKELNDELKDQLKHQKHQAVDLSSVPRFPKSSFQGSCPMCKNIKFKNLHHHRHTHTKVKEQEESEKMTVREKPWYINDESEERKSLWRQSQFQGSDRNSEACSIF